MCVKRRKAPRQSAKILKSDLSAGRNAYPKVLWLPRFSMLIMCLQIRDEESKESKLVKYQPSDLCFQQRQKLHLLLAVAFVSVYIPTFVCIHTQRGRQFCSFNVQKIFKELIISEQYSTGEPEVSTESDGNAQKAWEGFRRARRTEVLRSYPITLGGVN